MVTPIPSKPEMLVQYVQEFMITPKQVKPEIPKSWIPSYQSLQTYLEYIYKFITYYKIDHNYNIWKQICEQLRYLNEA